MRHTPLPPLGRGFSLTLLLVTTLLVPSLRTQAEMLQGWARSVRGDHIDYHSAEDDVNRALMVRSLRRDWSIAWETAPVPADLKPDSVTFVWLWGMDASHERHRFDLSVDGKACLSFENPLATKPTEWQVAGKDGARLRLRITRSDRHGDAFGYAALVLPRSWVTPGKPVEIVVEGESANSRIWYMTFESAVEERVKVTPKPALLRTHRGPMQPVEVDYVHLGGATKATLTGADEIAHYEVMQFGWNSQVLLLPPRAEEGVETILLTIDGKQRPLEFKRGPVRRWKVDMVQHTHTDIGYTRPQTEILPEHLRFIDDALDHCDATDDYPDDARFRWTCEGSWAVREYLRLRPKSQIDRLRQRVAEGRIEITGMMFNISDLADENFLTAFLQPIGEIRKGGMPIVTAMQNDVNGAAWSLVDYFAPSGVRYITMGQHGHRARIPFDKPTAFWWESPSGARILAWRADHYNTGNNLGIHLAQSDEFEREILEYLDSLAERKYPFDRVSIQHSGYMTDNSPPALVSCRLIKKWNEKYEWPRLRSAISRDFLRYVDEEHHDHLTTHRQAWPDWWADGYGSAARETAAARETQAEMAAVEGLLAQSILLGLPVSHQFAHDREAIWDALAFYAEHTFGAAESITAPESSNSVIQWAEKSAYAWDAVKRSRMLYGGAMGLLRSHVNKADVPTIVFVNTLNWERSGIVEAYIDHESLPPGRRFRIVDRDGRLAKAQPLRSREDGTYWAIQADSVPAFGYSVYRIELLDGVPEAPVRKADRTRLENSYYRITIDPGTGAVSSLFDKQLSRELVDPASPWQLGQPVHETLGNRHQMEVFEFDDYERTSLSKVEVTAGDEGPLWTSAFIRGRLGGCEGDDGLQIEIRLFHDRKLIELHYRAMKNAVTDPESVYVAFPFALEEPKLAFESQGGVATLGKDLIPGTAQDWQVIQSFAAARGKGAQVLVSSGQIPLMQFGGINTGRFQEVAEVRRPHLYSWVLNNYWTTNFCASQHGELTWTYAITSTADVSDAFATRHGWSERIPLLARVIPGGGSKQPAARESLLSIEGDVLLVGARPSRDDAGILLHLREIAGRQGKVGIRSPRGQALTCEEVDVLGRHLAPCPDGTLTIQPLQVRFVRVRVGREQR